MQCSADRQLSFKCSVLTHQSIHLLLPSSCCIFHCDCKGQTVTSRHDQQPRHNLRLWSHHQQRVPYSFQRQPPTSLTLVPTSFALVPDSQPTVEINRRQAATVLSEHRYAENYAHCVNCDAKCFKTSDANLLRDAFNLRAQRRIRSSGLTELLLEFNPAASRRHIP